MFEKKEGYESKGRGDRGDRGGRDDRGGDKGDRDGGGEFRRRRFRPAADMVFDFKDVDGLKQFLAEGGKIVPARVNRLARKQQRKLTTAVKRARQLALLPLSERHERF